MSFKKSRIFMKTFVESQLEVIKSFEFQTKANSSGGISWVFVCSYLTLRVSKKANSYEDICWASVWSYLCLWLSNKSEFLWRHLLSLSLKFFKFMSFKQKRIPMKTLAESQFEVIYVYKFQKKANSDEDICWVSVWTYLSWRLSNKTEFLWTHLLSLILKLCKFMSFKQKRSLMKRFVESQIEFV